MFEHWFGTCCIVATTGFWATVLLVIARNKDIGE